MTEKSCRLGVLTIFKRALRSLLTPRPILPLQNPQRRCPLEKIHISPLLFILSLLFFSACSRTVEQPDTLALTAAFAREDGDPLDGSTVRLSAGGRGTDYALEDGQLEAAGLPRSGELELTLLDPGQEVQGAMTLSLGQGAVIDASTGADGVGHVTVRADTDRVALRFAVQENGALTCSLWLSE